jgi:hypothetical protein
LGLSEMLTPTEHLFLKPKHLINQSEHSLLCKLAGWSTNPIAVFFSNSRYDKPCICESHPTFPYSLTSLRSTH